MKFPWFIWIPRVLLIMLAMFAAMFSGDIFEMHVSWAMKLLGLFMHNIPVIILLLCLILTWKRPFIAGLIFSVFTLAAVIGLAWLFRFRGYFWIDMAVFISPLVICILLFFLAHYKRTVPGGE